jgi:protein dithiol oxidoreductase (disulfide-forming)
MRLIARAALALFALLPLACSAADEAAYKEGTQYKTVTTPQDPTDPAKVEVSEVFWYGCPHCFHLDPVIEAWRAKLPPDVSFNRVPSTLGRAEGEVHARAFYVAETLGVSDKVHKALFEAIHVNRKPVNNLEGVRALFESVAGVKPADFDAAVSSFMVDSRVRRAEALVRSYGVSAVPTVIVDGKYMTSASMAGSNEKALEVVDFLIEKVRKERKLKKK